MEPQTRRTLLATVLCLAILIGWLKVQEYLYPRPPEQPTTGPAAPFAEARPPVDATSTAGLAPDPRTVAPRSSDGYQVSDASLTAPIILGDDHYNSEGFTNPYEFAVKVSPVGASVESVTLSRHLNALATDKQHPEHNPYDLLRAVGAGDATLEAVPEHASFTTEQIRFRDAEDKQASWRTVELADVRWSAEQTSGDSATLRTMIQKDGHDVLLLEKTYRVARESHHLEISLGIENRSDQPIDAVVFQRGPVGLKMEDLRYDYRRVITAVVDAQGAVALGNSKTRQDVFDADETERSFIPEEGKHTLWAALGNKYFTCIVSPLPRHGAGGADGPAYAEYLGKIAFKTCLNDENAKDDLTFSLRLDSLEPIPAGQRVTMAFEVFCGPKSDAVFGAVPEAEGRGYHLVKSADSRWCTFEILTNIMLWLLETAYRAVGNYGIAIFILVIVVRLVLHPITKRGQINMMKMQKGMGKLKPKLEAIQQQYKNDKRKLQEEQVKLYREEGINPGGQILGCLPMALQMPVWIALWSMLNTNVDMRHQPFFWWITDLSSPDAMIPFGQEYNIPLLGAMMGPISSFNLLPIIMTATMYAQQKLTQKLTKPTTPVTPKTDKDGRPVPDQMAQQQKMMSYMMVFFGFIFYNFPSGLNLYILCSNVLGMLEQWRIKKHIREKDERGDFEPKKPPASADDGKPSILRRSIDHMQKKVEEAKRTQSSGQQTKQKKRRRTPKA